VLADEAFERLNRGLTSAISSMGLTGAKFGFPEYVEKQKVESEKLFQGYAKAKPNKEDAHAAAIIFLRGQPLDSWQRDIIGSYLSEPIKELSGAVALGSKNLSTLLEIYEDEVRKGELWRLTWHGLLSSYFSFDPTVNREDLAKQGWLELRKFLERTWPLISHQSGDINVPDWMCLLRKHSEILSDRPADMYARAYMTGDTERVKRIADDLGIPLSSWFWHALVLACVRIATTESDEEFRRLIPQLIQLIQDKPAFRDEAIEQILARYHKCKGAHQDERLRDYVVQPAVWKNPKLKAAGIATAWNRVPDPVWKMVLGWVNERNLKDFFDILAARNKADEGRLAFWSNYIKQILWTRLVFGADTMALKNRNPEIRDLIAREEGAFAQLTANKDVDAFMMQIGQYIIVEFSKKPNAAYIYRADILKFDLYKKYFNGGTDDLKYGYYISDIPKIVHRHGWEQSAANELKKLGIEPDKLTVNPSDLFYSVPSIPSKSSTATNSYNRVEANLAMQRPQIQQTNVVDMADLQRLIKRYSGVYILDKRGQGGGRLWVEDHNKSSQLERELKDRGFKWSNNQMQWYYPES
jgi:hypothetical protein